MKFNVIKKKKARFEEKKVKIKISIHLHFRWIFKNKMLNALFLFQI